MSSTERPFVIKYCMDKILHTFAVSIETLQILPLILENSPFPWIIAIFLKKILLEIKTFSSFLYLLTH